MTVEEEKAVTAIIKGLLSVARDCDQHIKHTQPGQRVHSSEFVTIRAWAEGHANRLAGWIKPYKVRDSSAPPESNQSE